MKLFYLSAVAFFLSFGFACSKSEHKAPTKPTVEAPAPKAAVAMPDLDQMPDIQTLTEDHKILLIRVAGDLSKVSQETKAKITSLSNSFNAALEKFKSAIAQRDGLEAKLKALNASGVNTPESQQEAARLTAALVAANATAVQAKSDYEELARQFAQLIETVKGERTKQR